MLNERPSSKTLKRQALPIPPQPPSKLKHSGPPATAAEYLRLVRQESAALPDIFISKTPAPPAKKRKSSYLPSPIPRPPPHVKPDPQWQRDLVYWFAELQRTVSYLPSADQVVPGASDKKFWELSFQKRPELTMLRSMDYVHKLRVLRLIDESVTIVEEEEDSSGRAPIPACVKPSLAVGRRAEWIFCLLSFVQPYVYHFCLLSLGIVQNV